jgi:hypothetical protein
VDLADLWAATRRRLNLGPTRGQLRATAAMWESRVRKANEQTREEHDRRKQVGRRNSDLEYQLAQEKRERRQAVARVEELEGQVRKLIADGMVEPARGKDCVKIKFHREGEAADWATYLGVKTGEGPAAYKAYQCKTCPRSPVTNQRYWHAGHPRPGQARAARETRAAQARQQTRTAETEGRTIKQLVGPDVFAKLTRIGAPAEDTADQAGGPAPGQ